MLADKQAVVCTDKVSEVYGRDPSSRQGTSCRQPAYKMAFCGQGRNNWYAQDYAQQAQRFDVPLRNEVKTGKKIA